MTRWIPAVTAMAAVVACGVVHGLWTDRWGIAEEPAQSAARLTQLPLTLDDWDGEVQEFKDRSNLAGRAWLRYAQRRTGKNVTVLLICDRPGPVSIHTPDACYGASGYTMGTKLKFRPKGMQNTEFWSAPFRKSSVSDQSNLRIYWGWNAGNGWQAADDPRSTFAGFPALYKLYLIREMAQATDSVDDDACVDLMRQLLPELQKTLFP
jgi:hypothetical protein